MGDLAYVNGRFMELADATVPVEDRGLQFGDGVYEVIRTYRGRPFQVEAHLARLAQSAAAIGLTLPEAVRQFPALIDEGIRRAAFPDCEIGTGSGCTPIRCTRAALPTVISRMEDLGLQLLDIRLRAGHFDEPGRRTSAERGSDQESPEAG